MRGDSPSGWSISKAPVLRTRSLSLRKPKVRGVEIRGEIGKLRADQSKLHPAIIGFDLFEDLVEASELPHSAAQAISSERRRHRLLAAAPGSRFSV